MVNKGLSMIIEVYLLFSDPETPVVEGTASEDQLRQVLKQQLETYFSR